MIQARSELTHFQVTKVDPQTLSRWLDNGEAMLLDVRESTEHAARRIPASRPMPLSFFDPAAVTSEPGKKVVLYCTRGPRSELAARRLASHGSEALVLDGGIAAWQRAGLATVGKGRFNLDVQRQVFLIVGTLIALGTALGFWVDPLFLVLPAWFGLGLIFAGTTGFCPLASLVAKLPWNNSASCCHNSAPR